MKKILVTGVAGFIGSNLGKKLVDSGYSVIGVDNLSQGTRENIPAGIEFHQLDVRSKEIYPLFPGVDAVFHLAAKNCLSDCLQDPLATSDINVTGTVNVLEAARRGKVRKFVYADSSAEYEGITEFPSRVERVMPIGPYAMSKRAGALFCESYAKMFGMNVTTLRYFNVYGPAQDWRRVIPPVMSAFIMKMLRGERPAIFGTGKKSRDFIYVDDVNDFHLLAIRDVRTDGRTFNLGSGKDHSVLEVFAEIARQLGARIEPVHQEELPGDTERTLADISDALSLGWKPRVAFSEGIAKSIEYLRGVMQLRGELASRV